MRIACVFFAHCNQVGFSCGTDKLIDIYTVLRYKANNGN